MRLLLCDWFKVYNYTPQAQLEREREMGNTSRNRVNTQHTDCRPTKDQKG